jgi:hypothetical protein
MRLLLEAVVIVDVVGVVGGGQVGIGITDQRVVVAAGMEAMETEVEVAPATAAVLHMVVMAVLRLMATLEEEAANPGGKRRNPTPKSRKGEEKNEASVTLLPVSQDKKFQTCAPFHPPDSGCYFQNF